MFPKRLAIAAVTSIALLGMAAGGASAATPFQAAHPRQAEVLGRAHVIKHKIAVAERTGKITPAKAARLRHKVNVVMHRDHALAARQGGKITRAEQVRMNHKEAKVVRRLPG